MLFKNKKKSGYKVKLSRGAVCLLTMLNTAFALMLECHLNTFVPGLKLSPYTCTELDPIILMESLFMRAKISCWVFSFIFFKLILLYRVMICSKYTGRTPGLLFLHMWLTFPPPPSVLSRDCVQWNRRRKLRKEIVLFFFFLRGRMLFPSNSAFHRYRS